MGLLSDTGVPVHGGLYLQLVAALPGVNPSVASQWEHKGVQLPE